MEYYKVYYDTLISRKTDVFKYVQQYYRCFMGGKSTNIYPLFSAHLQSSVFKLSKDLIDSIHEEGIVAYTS